MGVSTPEDRTFTAVGPGTPAIAWRRDPRWGRAEPLTLDGARRLVVVSAHPDDESLGAGGLVSTATARGLEVALVLVTDGEGSHPDSPTHAPAQLASRRVGEGRAAGQALGVPVEGLSRLCLPDGEVAAHEETLTSRLVDLLGDGRETLVVAPWRHDGHPDHEAAGRAASAAARRTGADLWEFPVWFWHWSTPDDRRWEHLRPFPLDDHAVLSKGRAIGAHATQVAPLSDLPGDEVLLTPDLLAHFRDGPEHFVRTPAEECVDDALEVLHRRDADPWGVESRWYEQRKRDLVLAMLPRPRFEHALEVGCSTGALAEVLARRCDRVVAVDRSPAALTAARQRFSDLDRVTVVDLDVPHEWPREESWDLVVVSEVGYFLSPAELDALVGRIASSLQPGGVLVLCHWRHPVDGWVLDADDVHARFVDHDASTRVPGLAATYRDRDVEIRVHTDNGAWPDPAA